MSHSENNKRIAKNTMFLYFRMLLIMLVSIYTSRIVLKILGVEDFGIYNIIAGVIVLFSFLNNALTRSTQRFLNYELGKNDINEVKRVFSMSMTTHIGIALLIFILSETIGLWFVNTQLNLPLNRMSAVNWIYQFSIFSFCIQVIRVPFNASVIAYEKMSFYAIISIIEAILSLILVYLLILLDFDKLILYSFLMFFVKVLVLILYKIYCNKKFDTTRFKPFWDSLLFKKLLSFSGWSLFGSVANVGANQGLNFLLNIFYGVTVNAAMGIANQVSTAIYSFVSSFQTAFNPQIDKSYASSDYASLINLIFRSSKFSYYLLLIIAIPVIVNIDFLLKIWLYIVPEYAASFSILIILFLLIDAISAPLWMSVAATGKIKNYQILMGIIIIMNFPIAFIFLKFGFPPYSVLIIRVVINLITYIVRIFYLNRLFKFPTNKYIMEVFLVSLIVTTLSFPIPYFIHQNLDGWYGLIVSSICSLFITCIIIFFIGIKKNERIFLTTTILKKIRK